MRLRGWKPVVLSSREGKVPMASDMWTYRKESTLGLDVSRGVDLTGFSVEALDGSIGKIDEATYDVGRSYIVVDTGPWIFGKQVLLPAAVVERVDMEDERVYVGRTKDQIKDAPELGPDDYANEQSRTRFASYYGPGGAGWRDPDSRAF
jgi:hypothetical protein